MPRTSEVGLTEQAGEQRSPKDHPYFGKTLARCRVGPRIGRGRTSQVFKAHYEPLEKDIAVKIVSWDEASADEAHEAFRLEARAIAKVDHEHIVKVLDVTEDQGCTLILMEFVPGHTLQDRLNDKAKLPPKKAVRIAHQIAQALQAAHAEKIVHRDVKPANVILTQGSDQVKVVDFGLAGRKDLANRAGTPLYMSPEACQGRRIDEKSDVYALGVCLYQMLTGEHPFTGDSVKEILAAHIDGEYRPASEVGEDLGKSFDPVIKKLLVKSKGYRPTAGEAARLLEAFLDDVPQTGKAAGRGRRRGRAAAPPPKKKSPAPMIAGIVGGVVVLGLVGFLLAGNGDEPTNGGNTGPEPVDPVDRNGPGGNNGTTPPPPTPTVDPKEQEAKAAFVEADSFAMANPDKLDEAKKKYEEVASAHPGYEWGTKALKAANDIADKIVAAEKAAAELERRKKAAEKAQTQLDGINNAIAVFNFTDAEQVAKGFGGLPGQSLSEVRKRSARISYLAEEFQSHVDQRLKDMAPKVPARHLFPNAPDDRKLVGANESGFQWDDGSLKGEYKWNDLGPKKAEVFEKVISRVSSQSDWRDQLFLAILAAELWNAEGGEMHKNSKNAREFVRMIDESEDTLRQLRRYFINWE